MIGERPIEDVAEFSALKKRLQRFGSWVVRRFSGTDVKDAASGFRAMSRAAALRLQVFGRYSYTMETLVQAKAEGLRVTSVPIRVNPQTRPSRLAKSMAQFVRRQATTIVRSFALYYPFRFFSWIGTVPFVIGLALLVRWGILWAVEDEYRSRVPSLMIGSVLVIVAVLTAERVVAAIAQQQVHAKGSEQHVIARSAEQPVRRGALGRRPVLEGLSAPVGIAAPADIQHIIVIIAEQQVPAAAAMQRIIAAAAADHLVADPARQRVGAVSA